MPDWCGFYNFYRAIIPDGIVFLSFGKGWGGVISCLFFLPKRVFIAPQKKIYLFKKKEKRLKKKKRLLSL
jgi:hypothetical protein